MTFELQFAQDFDDSSSAFSWCIIGTLANLKAIEVFLKSVMQNRMILMHMIYVSIKTFFFSNVQCQDLVFPLFYSCWSNILENGQLKVPGVSIF